MAGIKDNCVEKKKKKKRNACKLFSYRGQLKKLAMEVSVTNTNLQ